MPSWLDTERGLKLSFHPRPRAMGLVHLAAIMILNPCCWGSWIRCWNCLTTLHSDPSGMDPKNKNLLTRISFSSGAPNGPLRGCGWLRRSAALGAYLHFDRLLVVQCYSIIEDIAFFLIFVCLSASSILPFIPSDWTPYGRDCLSIWMDVPLSRWVSDWFFMVSLAVSSNGGENIKHARWVCTIYSKKVTWNKMYPAPPWYFWYLHISSQSI